MLTKRKARIGLCIMAVILLIQAIVALFAKKSEDENEDDEIAEPVNA